MALRVPAFAGLLHLLAPRASHLWPVISSRTVPSIRLRYLQPIPIILSIIFPSVTPLKLPSIFADIWESVLRAVPKKKTSHRKKRQRFLAGKALKDVTSLNKCSACGNVKRAHLLCPYCVREIRDMWLGLPGTKVEEQISENSRPDANLMFKKQSSGGEAQFSEIDAPTSKQEGKESPTKT